MLIGIVGKPSSGKTTFINAACLTNYKVAEYPFTTIDAQMGVAYVRVNCVCKEFNVKDNPRNSICIDGIRLIPIKLLDVAGLVPEAWKGKGLGNKFLDDLRRADALIHVVDASGSLDYEGRPVEPGSWNPLKDIKFLEKEITMWLYSIIRKDWKTMVSKIRSERLDFSREMEKKLSGLSINKSMIDSALNSSELDPSKPWAWDEEDLINFSDKLRKLSKPMIIAANKVDKEVAKKHLKRLMEIKDYIVIPTSALAEYVLRTLDKKGYIKYIPGSSSFEVIKKDISKSILDKIEMIEERILKVYGSTGVQNVLNETVFNLLHMIHVYPVEDANKLTDHQGNVLPDVFLVPKGTTAREFAYRIHTELGESFIHAIDVRNKKRVGEDYVLKPGDVIKIVSAKGHK
ncbi:MAG: redox-regulated ATPase YchF [Candidatus Odinarchaeota archaeon]|nr:redox-regulated ATPase YchF [Candidatus Odinarchaeota archaeon]